MSFAVYRVSASCNTKKLFDGKSRIISSTAKIALSNLREMTDRMLVLPCRSQDTPNSQAKLAIDAGKLLPSLDVIHKDVKMLH